MCEPNTVLTPLHLFYNLSHFFRLHAASEPHFLIILFYLQSIKKKEKEKKSCDWNTHLDAGQLKRHHHRKWKSLILRAPGFPWRVKQLSAGTCSPSRNDALYFTAPSFMRRLILRSVSEREAIYGNTYDSPLCCYHAGVWFLLSWYSEFTTSTCKLDFLCVWLCLRPRRIISQRNVSALFVLYPGAATFFHYRSICQHIRWIY